MKTIDYIREIQADLGDCEGIRYSKTKIRNVLRRVLCQLWDVTSSVDDKSKIVTLTGELNDLSACCAEITRVDGIVDGNGVLTKTLNTSKEQAKGGYTRKSCSPDGLPSEVFIINGTQIRLSPPTAKEIKVRVWCRANPPSVDVAGDIDIPCEMQSNLIRMVKAELLEVDDDSNSNISMSDRLLQRVTGLLGAQNKATDMRDKEK